MRYKRKDFARWLTISSRDERRILTPPIWWKWKIYALVDPRDDTVRYIGATGQVLDERLKEHLSAPTSRDTASWFRELAGIGIKPEIRLLTWVDDNKWWSWETSWIFWALYRGELLNRDPGGRCRGQDGKLTERGKKLREQMRKIRCGETRSGKRKRGRRRKHKGEAKPGRKRRRIERLTWMEPHGPAGPARRLSREEIAAIYGRGS